MGNLTVALSDKLIQRVRVKAAQSGKSMSRFVAEVLEDEIGSEEAADRTRERLAALQRIFDGPKYRISENGRMPTAEERNARR